MRSVHRLATARASGFLRPDARVELTLERSTVPPRSKHPSNIRAKVPAPKDFVAKKKRLGKKNVRRLVR